MGGENAGGKCDRRANKQGQEGKLNCGGVAFEDDAAYRRLKFKGLPQITANHLTKIASILDVERLIETERVPQLRRLTRRGSLSEHLLDRIARYNVDQEKNHGEHQ